MLHDETAKAVAQNLGREVVSLATHCDQKSPLACAECLARMEQQIRPHFAAWSQTARSVVPATTFRDGQMEITLHPTALASAEISRVSRSFGEGHAVNAPVPQAKKTEERRGLDRGKLEIVFTIVTLFATVSAGLVNGSNTTLSAVLYAIAFMTGGCYGLIDGVGALKDKRLDVNLLMILAAFSLSGLPAGSGFVSKTLLEEGLSQAGGGALSGGRVKVVVVDREAAAGVVADRNAGGTVVFTDTALNATKRKNGLSALC